MKYPDMPKNEACINETTPNSPARKHKLKVSIPKYMTRLHIMMK